MYSSITRNQSYVRESHIGTLTEIPISHGLQGTENDGVKQRRMNGELTRDIKAGARSSSKKSKNKVKKRKRQVQFQ